MKKTKKVVMLAALSMGALSAGCSSPDPVIACGREWNPAVGYVADTGSVFRMADELIIPKERWPIRVNNYGNMISVLPIKWKRSR